MRTLATFIALIALAGCESQKEAKAPAKAPDPTTVAASSRPGEVHLPADSPKLNQIKVQAVVEQDVPVDVVEAPGQLEVNPNRISRVVTPLAGRVINVFVRLGDSVKEGQPVVTIESPDADAAISSYLQADSALGQMKANQIKAQADFDRTRDLLEHQAVAKKELLNADNALTQAKAQVDQAAAAREQSLRRLEILGLKPGEFGQKVTLRAPVSGKVLELNTVPGEFRNDTNAPLLTIADLSTVWVASDVPETSIRFIRQGEPLELELAAYPGELFHARVTRIADTVDPATRTIKVRAELQNRDGRLRPDMFGRIRHVESNRRLPVVPTAAVLQTAGSSAVYVAKDAGTFLLTPVQLGNRTDSMVGVLSGLSPGDRVVTDGVMLLQNN